MSDSTRNQQGNTSQSLRRRRNNRPIAATKAATSTLRNQFLFGPFSWGGPVGLGGRESKSFMALETLRSYKAFRVSWESIENERTRTYGVWRESEGKNTVDPNKTGYEKGIFNKIYARFIPRRRFQHSLEMRKGVKGKLSSVLAD